MKTRLLQIFRRFTTLAAFVGLAGMLITAPAQATNEKRYEISELPEPMQRYLRFALPGQPVHTAVRMKLKGKVILPGHTQALDVSGEQLIAIGGPEFDWQVKADINFAITAHIRDHYVDGSGSILTKANGLVTMIDDRDIAELDKTQLARWSGLAVMLPQSFLDKSVFTYHQTGPETVEATVRDGNVEIRHAFTFDDKGGLVDSRSSDRWERYDGVYKQTGSIMYREEYVEVAGTMVPTRFRVVRIEPDGAQTEFWTGFFYNIKPVQEAK